MGNKTAKDDELAGSFAQSPAPSEEPNGAAVSAAAASPAAAVPATPTATTERVRPALIVAGPSGVGKGALLARLMEEYPQVFEFSISHTTRAPRPGEVDGVNYHFVSQERFMEMLGKGEFLEHAKNYDHNYGTSIAEIDRIRANPKKICLLEIDLQGIIILQSHPEKLNSAIFVFLSPPSIEALEERLKKRGTEDSAKIFQRIETAKSEVQVMETLHSDIRIVNDDFDTAYRELRAFVVSKYPVIQGVPANTPPSTLEQ